MDTVQLCKPRTSSQTRAGKRFAKPRSSWPDRSALVASAFPSWDSYKEHVTGPANESEILTPGTFAALEADATNWSAEAELTNALTRWARVTPPEDRWWKYIVEKPADDWTTSSEPYTRDFVPGLGLKIKYPDYQLNEQAGAIVETTFTNQTYVIEAGTDCIGFAQRAMGWRFSTMPLRKKAYEWKDLPDGMTEYDQNEGEDNVWAVMQSVSNRAYPVEGGAQPDASVSIVHNRSGFDEGNYCITRGDLTIAEATRLLGRLRLVVPGDIWVKDTTTVPDATGDDWRDHIAIVAYVPPNSMELDAATLMSQIILIEGVYTNKIQSVIKKLSVGDYNQGFVRTGRQIYPAYTVEPVGFVDGVSLNCQSWAIRRLK